MNQSQSKIDESFFTKLSVEISFSQWKLNKPFAKVKSLGFLILLTDFFYLTDSGF